MRLTNRFVHRHFCSVEWHIALRFAGASLFCLCLSSYGSPQSKSQHIEVPVTQNGFHPEQKQTITISFGATTVVFHGTNHPILQLQKDGRTKAVLLPDDVFQLSGAKLYGGDRLIIAGMVNGDVWKIVVVDASRGNIVDGFLCYSPSISPDGHYIAFIKFYPAHGISMAEDHYMLYNVALSPSQNRPAGQSTHPAEVGRAVFPLGIANLQGDNVDLDRPVHEIASDGFFWNDISTRLIFADRYLQQYSVVVVDVSGSEPITSAVQVPDAFICPNVPGTCFERLARVSFSTLPAKAIELEFRGFNGTPAHPSTIYLTDDQSAKLSLSPTR